MAIITLTTDYGSRDFYAASAKGVLYSRFPQVNVVDISHEIDMYNIGMGSYVLKNAFANFPENTIHVFAVDASLSHRNKYLVMRYKEHYFIAPDNGALSLILVDDVPEMLYQTKHENESLFVFFSRLIKHILNQEFEQIGGQINKKEITESTELRPHIMSNGDAIKGYIVYEDRYGNAVTNISRETFDEIGRGRAFELSASKYTVHRINRYYDDFNTAEKTLNEYGGKLIAIFNQNDQLQLSLYKGIPEKGGSVKSLLGLTYRDSFLITFKE